MATIDEVRKAVVEQVRKLRLEEKRLRVAALGFDSGVMSVSDLALSALRYAAEVRIYRDLEEDLRDLGERVPKAVRDGDGDLLMWTGIEDAETQPCAVRRASTLQ